MITDPAYVLYVDHQGHPAPLLECFHATASRRLSSTVDRQHRPSTVTQVDSAYCPQCLSFHDASSAAQLGYCPKPTCVQCPVCRSVVTCGKLDNNNNISNTFGYACGRCSWNSLQCNLSVTVDAADSGDDSSTTAVTKEQVVTAVAQLAALLQERRAAGGALQATEEHYKQMVAAWEGVVKPPLSKASSSSSGSIHFKGRRNNNKGGEEEAWSVETLEVALQKKQESMAVAATESVLMSSSVPLQRLSLEEEQTLDPALQNQPAESMFLQGQHNGSLVMTSMADLLPLSVPLRSRKSRRCRAELAEGKPGILLKPKLNPLEGDSSLRTGHGQWWKKDSSAVHVMPRVRVIRHGSMAMDNNTQQHAFLLKVTNPTLGMVGLQIGLSTYQGEPFWSEGQISKNQRMDNLLIESLTDKHVDAFLLKPTNSNNSQQLKSELVELESAEDTIVDIGKVRESPEAVSNWNAESAIKAVTPSNDATASLDEKNVAFLSSKLIDKKSGSAWFELVCAATPAVEATVFPAIPISLQIQVGNGSWESSLIKASAAAEESKEADMVSFDLVLTWSESP